MTLQYAEKMARYWVKKATELGTTERFNQNGLTERFNRKEKGERKEETSPHTPYKEKREREEKAAAAAAARACVCVRETAATSRPAWVPTLEQVEQFAAVIGATPAFARSWYDQMERVYQWRHPKDGQRIRNWQRNLQLWWKRRDEFDPLPPPEKPPEIDQTRFLKTLEGLL